MSKNFYTPENIEAYLENKLSLAEREQFENGISKDPLIQNEIGLQKDIINSLKNYRKAELKNRLNNIEVSLTPNYYYSGLKIAASIVVSGLIGLGIYSYINNKSNSTIADKAVKKEVYVNNAVSENQKNNSSLKEITSNENDENTETGKTNIKTDKPGITTITDNSNTNNTKYNNTKNINIKRNNNTKNNINKPSSEIIKLNPKEYSKTEHSSPIKLENFGNPEQFEKENNINLPDGNIAQITETKSGMDISIDRTTDKKFHYKYYNNKLFLYGNFDSKTYEILELNTYKGKQVYLYYDKNYYQLNSNQIEVTPLSRITDEKAIEDLKKLNK